MSKVTINGEQFIVDSYVARALAAERERHAAELARATATLPCGHPRACVVGDGLTHSCGWCDALARAEAAEAEAAKWRALVPSADLLRRLADSVANDGDWIKYWGDIRGARILAARIEAARSDDAT
jgi:hypothetical protein